MRSTFLATLAIVSGAFAQSITFTNCTVEQTECTALKLTYCDAQYAACNACVTTENACRVAANANQAECSSERYGCDGQTNATYPLTAMASSNTTSSMMPAYTPMWNGTMTNGSSTVTTTIVCPSATTLTYGGKTYTATGPTTYTLTSTMANTATATGATSSVVAYTGGAAAQAAPAMGMLALGALALI